MCQRMPDNDGRCRYYLKNGAVRLDNNFEMDVNPMDLDDTEIAELRERNGR